MEWKICNKAPEGYQCINTAGYQGGCECVSTARFTESITTAESIFLYGGRKCGKTEMVNGLFQALTGKVDQPSKLETFVRNLKIPVGKGFTS